ncbi:MAG: NAD-dependent epimerase/dehydratase family protein [Methylocella sp.]
MKIFLAGATGAVGRRLVPLLRAAGHEVAGMTRSRAKANLLRSMGATPVIADALDTSAVMSAVRQAKPEIVIHQLTSIQGNLDLRNFDREFALTNRLRKEGTDYLLAAARAAGARRFIAQSFAGWSYTREGRAVKSEEDPLDPNPPPAFRRTLEAIRYLESAVTGQTALEGLVLRYGYFYGPGTAIGEHGSIVNDVRKRRIPIIGGGGVWSFIHVDDVARFTRAGVERGLPGIYNIVDDDPAPVSQWLPVLAETIGAKPPRRIPAWFARFLIGDAVMFMTDVQGASNAKAKRAFGVNLIWPSWRDGFRSGLGDPSQA